MKIKDKKKIVEDLIDSFEGRSDLHRAYKDVMKKIICDAIIKYADHLIECEEQEVEFLEPELWVHYYAEKHFRPIEE